MDAWSISGYSEIRELGSGMTGRVVLARDDATGIPVAIKYLSSRMDDTLLPQFRAEARLMDQLADPNIARFYEYVETPAGAAIVMELVRGAPLRALIREEGATGPEAALLILKGSLLGLAAAHDLGIVHRDYKPENVLVTPDGGSKLVDFGIAVPSGLPGVPAGTPPYMAPEQWAGAPAAPATDVYAATCVFFECITGHRPYRSTEPLVLRRQHQVAQIPVEEVPEPLQELLVMGLAKDPLDRPETAESLIAHLDRVAGAAYGEDWEERARRRLVALVELCAPLLPAGAGIAVTTRHSASSMLSKTSKAALVLTTLAVVGLGSLAIATAGSKDSGDVNFGGVASPVQASPAGATESPGPQSPGATPAETGPGETPGPGGPGDDPGGPGSPPPGSPKPTISPSPAPPSPPPTREPEPPPPTREPEPPPPTREPEPPPPTLEWKPSPPPVD